MAVFASKSSRRHELSNSNSNSNRPFPSSLVPLFQSESKCETSLMKITLICMKMKLYAELIFIWKVLHFGLVLKQRRKRTRKWLIRFAQSQRIETIRSTNQNAKQIHVAEQCAGKHSRVSDWFYFPSDWMTKWREVFKPIVSLCNVKPNLGPVAWKTR